MNVVITPNTGTSQGNVYIALIEQYHYVGLDKVEVPSNVCESESTDDSLNDVTIAEGDEHTRHITGKPEADDQIYSIAPAEGQKPIYIMTDTNFALAVVVLLQKDLEK